MIIPTRYNLRKIVAPVFAMVLFALAVILMHRLLKQYHISEIRGALHAIRAYDILFALILAALSYFVLTFYDTLAFSYIGKPLAYRKIALTSFISYTFANNTGTLSILASSSIRYRFYSGWGFSGIEIAKIISFCVISFWLGYLFLSGVSFLAVPPRQIFSFPVAQTTLFRFGGCLFLVLVCIYLALTFSRKKSIKLLKWDLALPAPRLAFAQITVAAVDLLSAMGALYVLLPDMNLPFIGFVSLFLLAMMLGLLSNVPGGLGVFESIMLLLLTPYAKGAELVSALLLFRVIYYFLPLGIAITVLGGLEILSHRSRIARLSSTLQQIISVLIPQVFALATLVAGGILLFSGTMPRLYTRIAWLIDILPLPILELSHFVGSMAGMGLLILAIGLRRRLDMAYYLTIVLLGVGIATSLLKGLDYEDTVWLIVLLAVLSVSRGQFYRRASLLAEPISPAWLGTLFIVLFGNLGLGLFIYRHQKYMHDLWWQFSLHGDASRFMRGSVGALAVICFFALARLFKAYRPQPSIPSEEELRRAADIAAASSDTHAYLALLGDKTLLFSSSGETFLMYGIKGKSWIAMGDPVGDDLEKVELIWQFKNIAERFDGWPVFYEVGHENLSWYIDMGMTVLKIGEVGRVDLADFTLTGSKNKGLRYIHNRLEKEECRFEIIHPAGLPAILPELRMVSDDWLRGKKAGEKGFSLGYFNPRYLSYFPVAVVLRHGRILAFANLWPGAGKEELSIDLMRYCQDAPHGIMDYIFCEIMLWGKNQGYRWFSLGMVPLAGLEPDKVASLWGNVATLLYQHGEHFYNFKGLRSYKDKFNPVWKAKYLVTPGGLQLPLVFANLTTLIGGGIRKVVSS